MADKKTKELDEDIDLEDFDDDEISDSSEEKESKESESTEDSELDELLAETEKADSEGQEETEDSQEKEKMEALRVKRRRQKKLKRERERREHIQLQNTIVALQEKIKKIEETGGGLISTVDKIADQNIQNEMNELAASYNQAQAAMERAISEGDGANFTKAKNISDKAWARYNTLQMAKQQRLVAAQNKTPEAQTENNQSAPVQLGETGKRYGVSWTKKNAWFNPNGNDYDSRIVKAIDADLYNEGYDPETEDYWEELTERVKDRLPHRYKNQTVNKKKPPQIVGGSGNDFSANTGALEKTLPKELIENLKVAGMWEDKNLRQLALKDYLKNRKKSA